MIAVHITHEHAYHQILNEGLIKPSLVQRPDMEGFGGYGFGADGLAGDTRFVFLRLSEKYQLMTSTEKCVFSFDVHRLIAGGATIGIDLGIYYDRIINDCITAVDATLPKKPPMTDAELDDFCERMQMPKDDRYPQFREHMIADSMSHYQDLMNGIHDPDDLSGPVEQVRRLFREQAAIYQQAYRICGLRGTP